MTPEPRILLTSSPDEADRRAVREGLLAHNEPFIGPADHRPLAAFARDRDGRLVGGLVGETGRGILHVDMLWVEGAERGRGLGSRLLLAAEAEAAARGCSHAWLITADFQARPFYERHGYVSCATMGRLPGGHAWFMLAKDLPPARPTPG
jgi:GNAT superfamily N-acetyltransferase